MKNSCHGKKVKLSCDPTAQDHGVDLIGRERKLPSSASVVSVVENVASGSDVTVAFHEEVVSAK